MKSPGSALSLLNKSVATSQSCRNDKKERTKKYCKLHWGHYEAVKSIPESHCFLLLLHCWIAAPWCLVLCYLALLLIFCQLPWHLTTRSLASRSCHWLSGGWQRDCAANEISSRDVTETCALSWLVTEAEDYCKSSHNSPSVRHSGSLRRLPLSVLPHHFITRMKLLIFCFMSGGKNTEVMTSVTSMVDSKY